MIAVGYDEPNRMKLAVPCTTAALALFSSRFLLVKAEAAVWNWVWLILAVGGLIRVILSIKVCVACNVVGPLD